MKILIIGSKGQLGYELVRQTRHLGIESTAADLPEIDITEMKSVRKWVEYSRASIVINAAAYTNVDKAESEASLAYAVNSEGPKQIAEACTDAGISLLHISTDYVFNGKSKTPYMESDPVEPLGIYGKSKEDGEKNVRKSLKEHIIIRTSWLYGVHGHNFVKAMLRLGKEKPVLRVVADQFGSPTFAADLAEALLVVARRIETNRQIQWGTYHFCNQGIITWHHFAETIFEMAMPYISLAVKSVEPISTDQYPTTVRRPMFSALDCGRIQGHFKIHLKPWRESLGNALPGIVNDLN